MKGCDQRLMGTQSNLPPLGSQDSLFANSVFAATLENINYHGQELVVPGETGAGSSSPYRRTWKVGKKQISHGLKPRPVSPSSTPHMPVDRLHCIHFLIDDIF